MSQSRYFLLDTRRSELAQNRYLLLEACEDGMATQDMDGLD